MPNTGTYKPQTREESPPSFAFNMGAIALVIIMLGLGVAYLIDGASQQNKPRPELWTAGPTVEKIVAGQKLAIPPSWFRFADQRSEGFSEKIDLWFALPLGPNNQIMEIDVSLVPHSRARSSAQLLDAVYLHQFLPNQVKGPPGLVGKPLRNTEGFQKETVWYDPLSANPFVTKCMEPISSDKNASCIRTILISDQVAATYIFDIELLAQWKRFDDEAGRWLARIGGIKP